MIDITQEKVKHLFDYHTSGNLIRRVIVNNRTKIGGEVGSAGERGYRLVVIDYFPYKLHRLIFLWHHGYFPEATDHIDGNTSNNKIENLRACSWLQNNWNQKLRKSNTSGVKGVSWNKKLNRWRALIGFNRKLIHVGYFDSIEEAREVLEKERDKLHGEFANHGSSTE